MKKCPSKSVPASIKRNLNMEMQVRGLETLTQEIRSEVHAFKTDFSEGNAKTQSTLNTILKLLQPQASNPLASTAQPTQSEAQGQAPSQAQDQTQAPGDPQPPHLITNNHSKLDRRCNAELGL